MRCIIIIDNDAYFLYTQCNGDYHDNNDNNNYHHHLQHTYIHIYIYLYILV